jgi:hypothetical protein
VDFTYIFKDYTLFEVIHSSFSMYILRGMYILTTNESLFLELCKYWSSPEFKPKSEKKRMNRGNDPKHRYNADGHIRKSQRMVRFHCPSAIHMNIVMRLTLNYMPSGMTS